jgi:nucleotide-binding universal stress UspA family protein
MVSLHRVLCPVDFSPVSRRALAHAAALARWYQAPLQAVHVVPLAPSMLVFPPGLNAVTITPAEKEAVRRELEEFVASATEGLRAVELTLLDGDAATQIVIHAAEAGADLLVLGTHGRTGFERWVLGSVTEKVLRKVRCPVLTVPPAPTDSPHPVFKRVLCGVDFSGSSQSALQYALSLAQEADAHLTLLYVLGWEPEEELAASPQFDLAGYRRFLLAQAQGRLEGLVPEEARDWCEIETRLACGKPYREILRIAGEEKDDLIVLGVHGRGVLDRMLFGSTTQAVVRQAGCPVLTVRSRDELKRP